MREARKLLILAPEIRRFSANLCIKLHRVFRLFARRGEGVCGRVKWVIFEEGGGSLRAKK